MGRVIAVPARVRKFPIQTPEELEWKVRPCRRKADGRSASKPVTDMKTTN